MCRDKWKIDVGREINNETRERRGKKERKKERRKENERKMKSSMDLWFETLSGGLIAAVFMGGGWPPSPKWIACSTPFNSGFQQVDDGLIPLIFRENHPRKSGGILNPDKWENDPRRVSRATGTRFSGENPLINLCLRCLTSPRDIFVSGYLVPRPTTSYHPCVERINIQAAVEREEEGSINQSLRSTQSRATCSTD